MIARGFLIGTAEAIPGVSGGTIALIVGLYRFLIDNISFFFLSIIGIFKKSARPVFSIQWPKLGLIAIGMILGLLVMARLIEPLLLNYPTASFSFFGGLVLASIYFPLKFAGKVSASYSLWLVLGAFLGLILSGGFVDWQLQVATPVAAAFAISALVLPGVSGSFLLLLLGNYESTIAALNSFDLGYLASFAGGALVGLVTIVFVVKWCLDRFPKATYLFMAGLMFGSLEGLFPEPDPELVEYFAVVPPAFLGIAVVVGFIFLDRRMNFSSTEGMGQ